MTHEHRLRFKTLFTVLLMVVCANVGDLLLKRGMTQIGAVHISLDGLKQTLLSTVQNGTIWLAILFLLGFTLCYMSAVSWADWIGVFVICIGVLLVGHTKPNTTNSQQVAS